jgi:hypothetical protein
LVERQPSRDVCPVHIESLDVGVPVEDRLAALETALFALLEHLDGREVISEREAAALRQTLTGGDRAYLDEGSTPAARPTQTAAVMLMESTSGRSHRISPAIDIAA